MHDGKWQWCRQRAVFRSRREGSGPGRAAGVQGRVSKGAPRRPQSIGMGWGWEEVWSGEGRNQHSIQDSGLGALTNEGNRPGLPACAQGALSWAGKEAGMLAWDRQALPALEAYHRGLFIT